MASCEGFVDEGPGGARCSRSFGEQLDDNRRRAFARQLLVVKRASGLLSSALEGESKKDLMTMAQCLDLDCRASLTKVEFRRRVEAGEI